MLSDFRNKLAHGRTATLTSVKLVDATKWDEIRTKRSLADWEQLIQNGDFAKRDARTWPPCLASYMRHGRDLSRA
jgi:hypothetical protein